MSFPFSYAVTAGNSKFNINASAATENIFDILNLNFIVGSGNTALDEPGSSVISQSCAKRLFGQKNPIGQALNVDIYGGRLLFTVKGIIKDPPVNSEFQSEMYLSWVTMNPPDWKKNWWGSGTHILVKVLNDGQKNNIEQKMNTILARHEAPYVNGRFDFQLVPLKSSHFRTDIEEPMAPPISARLLWILSIVAVFIIVVACINFVSLAIGQSEKSSKETGISKVLGASRARLAFNFFVVTFQKAVLASVVAFVLTISLARPFKKLALMKADYLFSEPVMWLV
jgi:putative ABC transport system permease protein